MSLSVTFYTKPFRDLIESIKDVVPTVVLSFAPDGLDMQSMDVNKVALVEFFITAESFVDYQYPEDAEDNEESIALALDLKSLFKILKCAKANSQCKCVFKLNGNSLKMNFTNDNEVFSFNLKLLNIDSNRLPIPERENNVTMTFPTDLYQSFTKDIATLTTDITISVGEFGNDGNDGNDENDVQLKFEFGSDLGNGSWTVKFVNGIELHDYNEEVSQRFSISYLQNFSKAVMNAGRADVSLKAGEPIEIVCPLPRLSQLTVLHNQEIDGDDIYPFGYLKFFLAPKVEENE